MSPLAGYCPITLGASGVSPLEMTFAYATVFNDGVHCRPYRIAKVISRAEIPMRDVHGLRGFGGLPAAPIWHDYMVRATRGLRVMSFPPLPRSVRDRPQARRRGVRPPTC